MLLNHLLTLLLPHLVQQRQSLIIPLLPLKCIQRLHQYLPNTRIPPHPQQLLNRLHELGVDISRECSARVVRQDPDQHDAIILDVRFRRVVLREVLSDNICCLFCSSRGRLAGFDDGWEVEDFFTLLLIINIASTRS